MKRKNSERGQALVLIAFGIIALVGMTGLAIDGGNAYSDRRHAQNAADTSILAGALAFVRQEDWKTIADQRAISNGYNDTDPSHSSSNPNANVEIYSCAETSDPGYLLTPCPGALNGDGNYIEAVITSHVRTFFARVIGIPEMVNKVQAIAHVIPQEKTAMYPGNALVGLDPNQCKALMFQGNADTVINNGGIFVNSNCIDSAFFNNSGSATLSAPSLCVVGGITAATGVLNIPSADVKTGPSDCPPLTDPSQAYTLPPLPKYCPSFPAKIVNGTQMSPGYYSSADFGNQAFPPAGVTLLQAGVYCITDNNFTINGGQDITGYGVTIYVQQGSVTWNGGANIKLTAPSGTGTYFDGLLLYVDQNDHNPVSIAGNPGDLITGTILAPGSQVYVGGDTATTVNGQIIGYDVTLTGHGATTVNYNAGQNFTPLSSPSAQLTK